MLFEPIAVYHYLLVFGLELFTSNSVNAVINQVYIMLVKHHSSISKLSR